MKSSASKIQQYTQFSRIAKFADIPIGGFNSFAVYEDPGFFYDLIADTECGYVNFCKITDINRCRYEVLIAINESGISHFIPSQAKIVEVDGDEWFVEVVPRIPNAVDMFSLDMQTLGKMWHAVSHLNNDVANISVEPSMVAYNNKFFTMINYYEEMKFLYKGVVADAHVRRLQSTELYMNYVDFEKSSELGRIGFDGHNFTFAGLQSFLPCPSVHGQITSAMFLLDDVKDIETLRFDRRTMRHVFDAHIEQMRIRPDFYTYNVSSVIGRLCLMRDLI